MARVKRNKQRDGMLGFTGGGPLQRAADKLCGYLDALEYSERSKVKILPLVFLYLVTLETW